MSDYAKLYGEAREAAAYVKVFAKSDAAEVHVERLIRAHKEQADAIEALEAKVERLAKALRGTIGVATWMSGSADFAPEGIAGEGWPSQREILYAAMDTLRDLGIPLEGVGDATSMS